MIIFCFLICFKCLFMFYLITSSTHPPPRPRRCQNRENHISGTCLTVLSLLECLYDSSCGTKSWNNSRITYPHFPFSYIWLKYLDPLWTHSYTFIHIWTHYGPIHISVFTYGPIMDPFIRLFIYGPIMNPLWTHYGPIMDPYGPIHIRVFIYGPIMDPFIYV